MTFKRNHLFYGGLVLLAIGMGFLLSLWFLEEQDSCSGKKTVRMSLLVEQADRLIVGMNTDTDHLNFGKASPGGMIKRSMVVSYSQPAKVTILLDGDFSSWIAVSQNNFNLLPEEKQEVSFEVVIPEDAFPGNYSGGVIYCFKDK